MRFATRDPWLRIGGLAFATLCLAAPAPSLGGWPPRSAIVFGLDPVFGDDFESAECSPWTATSNPIGAPDGDLDLYGDESQPTVHCELPAGHVANALDCNDDDPGVNPAAAELCNGVDDNCDGSVDEGLVLDSNPTCPMATNLGALSGDTGSTVLAAGSHTERWYLFRVTEDALIQDLPLKVRIALAVPPGVDFDLYVTCFTCADGQVLSSTTAGVTGHTEEIYLGRNDAPGADGSFFVLAEVRYFTSQSCAPWGLTVARTSSATQGLCLP